ERRSRAPLLWVAEHSGALADSGVQQISAGSERPDIVAEPGPGCRSARHPATTRDSLRYRSAISLSGRRAGSPAPGMSAAPDARLAGSALQLPGHSIHQARRDTAGSEDERRSLAWVHRL